MKKKIDVILLCGGKGKRLKKLTYKTPKPLLKVDKKKPFIQYLINFFLKSDQIENIILATGYKSHLFQKLLDKNFKSNKRIKLIDSGKADILKRIKSCENVIKNNFMICYGDSFASINLTKYINFFFSNKKSNLVLSSFHKFQFGALKVEKRSKKVKFFIEKPLYENPLNLGYFIFKKEIFEKVKKIKSWIFFLKYLSKKNILSYYNFSGLYVTYNNQIELKIAEMKMQNIKKFIRES